VPLPAATLLDPASEIKPAWARFDRDWYLRTHAQARDACIGQPPEAALAYYLAIGGRLGHSPSPLFDEPFYLARNVDVAELIRAGNYASGFDHFCRFGHRALSPHWLFDDFLYASLYEDMSLDNLDQHRCYGRYDHWLKSGQRERRMAHLLFDNEFYRARALEAGVAQAELDAAGPYTTFLYRLGTAAPELPSSIYFDPDWYLDHNPAARPEIASGLYNSAIHHYLCSDEPAQLDPVPQFSEQFYRQANPDVVAAIESGFFRSGYQHFIQQGAFELRRPAPDIDLIYYRDMHQRVRDDLNLGDVRDAFAHLRLIGLKENLAHHPPEALPTVTEPAAKQAFLLRARNNLALFAHRKLNFAPLGPPVLSVIMVLFNKFELTMLALCSLRDNFAGGIELILVDNDSSDDTRRIEDYVRGAKLLRTAQNFGFLRACNAALPHATAPALLYLNNDTELGHGAIVAALARLASHDKIAAVGGKIIRTHGALQEAGSIVWSDGMTTGYMRDASPLAPEANFVRDVDFCSAVFLLCRTDPVKRLGGFDEAFSPAYYEEVDLCARLIGAGYRVVYDPGVVVHHLEYGSASTSEASMALMRRGRRTFKLKHAAFLETRPKAAAQNLVLARARNDKRRRVLFLEDTIPIRRLGSGFVRANDCVHAIAAAGYDVTIFPVNGAAHDIMSLHGDFPEDMEVMHDRGLMQLKTFLTERPDHYDLIWISRTHNLERTLPILERCGITDGKIPIVLDTEAVVAARAAARHRLQGGSEDFDFDAALRAEFALAKKSCRHVTAVNDAEVALLRRAALRKISRLGTIRAPNPTEKTFGARAGLLFVAAIHEQDSPNFDALLWYAREILPGLAAQFAGAPPILHVAGHSAPHIDLSMFAGHSHIRLHGSVGDLRPLYNAARLFIAPTRYAAGTPYKIYETASFGLPSVATDLLATQLAWQPGTDMLVAPADQPEQFAAQIARLYHSESLWQSIRDNALRRLAIENTAAEFNRSVANILRHALHKTGTDTKGH
jgi:GT2 family glycosyltransferase